MGSGTLLEIVVRKHKVVLANDWAFWYLILTYYQCFWRIPQLSQSFVVPVNKRVAGIKFRISILFKKNNWSRWSKTSFLIKHSIIDLYMMGQPAHLWPLGDITTSPLIVNCWGWSTSHLFMSCVLLLLLKTVNSFSISAGCLLLQAEVSSGLQWSQPEPLLDLLQ